ncbi:MAG: hydrogenase small subunit, partial [Micromonosporaceae bacterium]|nr:hydrogenase small subunit [Micromonosporaceae bacterium]
VPATAFAERFAHAAETTPRLPVLWLNGQDCNGDSEGFLRSTDPTPAELLLDHLSLDYSELLMTASGATADNQITDTLTTYAGEYVLIVEGSIATASGGVYCCVGGRSFADTVKEAAAGAAAVIAVGSCATDGGLPLAAGGLTGAASVSTVLSGMGKTIINFPGCPMNIDNLTAALTQYITLGTWPALDSSGRPTFAYGTRVHAKCPRLPFFKAGQYVRTWGDAGHQAGWCLRYVGCQGQWTYANCPTKLFNSGTSSPVTVGAPCLGCSRTGFWDLLPNAFTWTPPATAITQSTAAALAES